VRLEKLDEIVTLLNSAKPSSCIMALRSTQPLTEIGIRTIPGGGGGVKGGKPTSKADNLSPMCELIF
jgi:hypothetical protein